MRLYVGCSLGVLLMMWLPALWAFALRFSAAAHWAAAGTLPLLCGVCWLLRDKAPAARWNAQDARMLRTLLWVVVPLTLLSGFLQYTHCLRPAADGSLHVGQSTYGDLSLHLSVAASAVNAPFPLHNSLMRYATMAYPYLSDTFASSFVLFGMPLGAAIVFTGTLMMALVYAGYALLCGQLLRRRYGVTLCTLLLFLNGGLGFFYTLSGTVSESGVVVTVWDNLRNVLTGYYQTPTNQPNPNNLRWSNILCDMLLPQRGILGGWTLLLPALNLLAPPLCARVRRRPYRGEATPALAAPFYAYAEEPALAEPIDWPHGLRGWVLCGVFAGALPLVHTHSFLALVLLSLGLCGYLVLTAPRGRRMREFLPFLLYALVAGALSLPQLLGFTFVQATGSNHFLTFQFNWCNNRGGAGLVDPYLWFYIKNIGLPFLLILLSLFQKNRQTRLLLCGAFCIFAVAEFIRFQPNEYDNNKLFYVWFLLALPGATEVACDLYERLRGLRGRRAVAALALTVCFLSSGLTVARECASDYEAYSAQDVQAAAFIREQVPEHAVFVTGTQHLNPVSALAGRDIVLGPDLYLYYHGFSTTDRKAEVWAFYNDPAGQLEFLRKYGVAYIYVSPWELYDERWSVNLEALEALFPCVYRNESGTYRIYRVTESALEGAASREQPHG